MIKSTTTAATFCMMRHANHVRKQPGEIKMLSPDGQPQVEGSVDAIMGKISNVFSSVRLVTDGNENGLSHQTMTIMMKSFQKKEFEVVLSVAPNLRQKTKAEPSGSKTKETAVEVKQRVNDAVNSVIGERKNPYGEFIVFISAASEVKHYVGSGKRPKHCEMFFCYKDEKGITQKTGDSVRPPK